MILFAVFAAHSQSAAATRWIQVSTPHFQMYTTNSEKQALKALQAFEQVRFFFAQRYPALENSKDQVRIIAFSSEREYHPYRASAGAFAYYLPSRLRDYIVMQDILPEHYAVVIHEYTHLVVNHLHLDLPVWLDEGLADLYSSLEPNRKQAMVGRPPAGRIGTLAEQHWMDWNTLLSVDHQSPYYNERNRMSIFYAQSWLLTHMLVLSPEYSANFPQFLTRVVLGTPAATAMRSVWNKSTADVAKDAELYFRRSSVRAMLFDVNLRSSDLEAQTSELLSFQKELALAELLAAGQGQSGVARQQLLLLESQNPKNAEVEEALGYLAWQNNGEAEARQHFSRAIECGSRNMQLYYDLAVLEQLNGGGSLTHAATLLSRVIAADSDNLNAHILLAEVEARQHNNALALAALGPVRKVDPTTAFRFFSVSAYVHANLQDISSAKKLADKAASFAKTDEERTSIAQLLNALNSAAASPPLSVTADGLNATNLGGEDPEEHEKAAANLKHRPMALLAGDKSLPQISGQLKSFECAAGQKFILHLDASGREMMFSISDPQSIVVRNVENLEWKCGALAPRDVTVIYKPGAASATGTRDAPKQVDGAVAELIF